MILSSDIAGAYSVCVSQYVIDEPLTDDEAVKHSDLLLCQHGDGHFVVAGFRIPEPGQEIDESVWLFSVYAYLH